MATTQAPEGDGSKRKAEVIGHMPIFESPYSKMGEHWITWQGEVCRDHEMDFALCSARVGVKNTENACKKYHDDLMECAYRIKTKARYQAMKEERKKQGRPHMDPPERDSIRIWKKDT